MNYYKQFLLVYVFTILKLVFSQKPYDNVVPFFGCRYCKSCGGQYTYYGGSKVFDSNGQQSNGWKFFGEECSDQYVARTDQQWKLCCSRDQALNSGLCRFCSTCGGDYKNNSGGRRSDNRYLALITSIFGDNCSSTIILNSNINFSLCCTQKNVVSLCYKCNYGQIEGGMYQLGKIQEIFNVNQMGSCGINDQYFTQVDNHYLCNNKQCPDNYVFKNNQCFFKCVDNCQICSSLTTCSQCFQNYNLIEGKCVFSCPIQNCEACSDEAIQQCIKCAKDFYIYQGQCQQCSLPNCQTCFFDSDLKSVICQACQQNYNLNTNLTQCDMSCPENCQKCSEPNKCLQCKEGYKQQDQQQQIVCTIVLCPNYCKCLQDNICSSCQVGYELVKQNDLTKNTCQLKCSINCEICDSPLICTKCQNGYGLNPQQKCQICNIEKCKECYYQPSTSNFVCNKCEDNYILNYYKSQRNMSCPLNCQKCSEPNICLQCQDGYRQSIQLSQIVCKAIVCRNDCKCQIDNICSSCQEGYKLVIQSDQTQNYCQLVCPRNCEYCTSPQTCYICQNGYALDSQKQCQYCNIENCKKCYYQNNTPSFVCEYCENNYTLNYNPMKCNITCPLNCQKCSEPNVCLQCQDGYKQSIQQKQIVCTAIICPNHCKCEQDNVCSSCQDGYKLVTQNDVTQNICQLKCPINCESCNYTTSLVCTQCQKGYFLDSQQNCQLCNIEKCVECSFNNSTIVCNKCENNYTLNQDLSQCNMPCPENCQKCSEPSICLSCKEGYRQQMEQKQIVCTAIICPNHCKCEQDNICSSCQEGYKLVTQANQTQNFCKQKCPINCEICTSSTPQVCNQCQTGYGLDSNQNCQQCNIKNCSECLYVASTSNFQCQQCENNYNLDSQKQQCIASCPKSCESCIEPNVCLKCQQGYKQVPDKNDIICSAIICPSDCKYCEEDSKCKECEDGFEITKNSQTCTKIVCKPGCTCSKQKVECCKMPFCLSCTSETFCTQCQNQYVLQSGYYNFKEQISCLLEEQCKVQNSGTVIKGMVCIYSLPQYPISSFSSLLNIQIIILIIYLLI